MEDWGVHHVEAEREQESRSLGEQVYACGGCRTGNSCSRLTAPAISGTLTYTHMHAATANQPAG